MTATHGALIPQVGKCKPLMAQRQGRSMTITHSVQLLPRPSVRKSKGRSRPTRPRRRQKGDAVKGDRIEVLIDVGSGVKTFEVVASRAGRRLEVSVSRGTVEISELTRTAQPVRTARFMASRVVALVEYPASDIAPSPE